MADLSEHVESYSSTTKTLYLHYLSSYGQQTWKNGNLSWWAPTHNFTDPLIRWSCEITGQTKTITSPLLLKFAKIILCCFIGQIHRRFYLSLMKKFRKLTFLKYFLKDFIKPFEAPQRANQSHGDYNHFNCCGNFDICVSFLFQKK